MNNTKDRLRSIAGAILIGARLGLGVALLWAGASKLRQPFDFLNTVYAYDLVGPHIGLLLAIFIPVCEVVSAVCLIGDVFVAGALLVVALMCVMFVLAQALAIHKGLIISCGCFGNSSDGLIGWGTMLRTLALLFGAALALTCYGVLKRNQTDIDRETSGKASAIAGGQIGETEGRMNDRNVSNVATE